MVKVRLPDGRIASFPDDMPREQIKAFVAQKYPNAYGEQSMSEFSPEALAQIEANNQAYDDKSHLGWNVAGGFVSGMGEGNLSGIGRLASGVSFGASDWLDRKTGGNLAALDDRLQRRADAAGLGLANKIAKAGTEIVGNVAPSAAITRGLARAGIKSTLGQAAAGGGVGGALYGATASDKLSDLPVNMLVGGVGGTVGGAALHSAISGIGTVGGLLRSNVKKGMDYLRSKFGDAYVDDMIREAEQKGLSLAEVADNRALKAVQMARQQTSDADDIITQNMQAIKDNVPNKNTETLNNMFGTKSGYRMKQEAEQAAMDKARPMFNELEAYGDLDPLYVKPGEKVPTGKLSKEQADALLKQEMGKLPTREQLASYPAESKFNPNNNYTRADALTALEKRADNMGVKLYNDINKVKEEQLNLINKSNPAPDEYHTWIRKKDDIKTFDEALQDKDYIDYNEFTPDYTRQMANDAVKNGKIKVYSSYDINNGTFVTPSKMEAMSYSGNGKVYEREVPLQDVAWISPMEGQYAPVDFGKGHFLKENIRLPNARTLENTVKNPDLTYSQTRKNQLHDYYMKKYDILENSFSPEELNKAFDKYNPLKDYDELSTFEQRNMFKKFAEEYKKHLNDYKDGTLFDKGEQIGKNFYNKLTEKQKAVFDDSSNMFMDLLSYFDDRVSDKGITELLDMVVFKDGKPYTKFNAKSDYLVDELNKKATSNISTSGRIRGRTDGGVYHPLPLSTSNIPSLGEVVNSNNVIGSAIKSVKGAYSMLKGLPDTDARVILETRKLLSRQTKSPDATLAFQAKQALKEFDDALPADFRKGLEEANKIYKDNYQFAEAQKSAKDIFNKEISPEEFSDKFNGMTAEEKRALRGGLRDELFSIVENRTNETLGWNRVVPRAVQSKIRRVMGVEEGNKLIEYAQGQLKSMRNLNKILGGSNTAEKLDAKNTVSTAVEALGNPTGSVGIMLKRAPWNNARNMGIARIMTNPSADLARSTYEQVASPQGWEAVYQALYNPRGFTKYNTALAAYLAGRELQQ